MSKEIEQLEKRLAELRAIENAQNTVLVCIHGKPQTVIKRPNLAKGIRGKWTRRVPLIEVEERK